MNRVKKVSKLVVPILLSVMMVFSSVIPVAVTADAVSESVTVEWVECRDENGNPLTYKKSDSWGACTAGKRAWKLYSSTSSNVSFVDANLSYCVEPGASLRTGNVVYENTDDALVSIASRVNTELKKRNVKADITDSDIKKAISLAMLYGFQGNSSNLSGNTDMQYEATQLIIWELVTGCRIPKGAYKRLSTEYYDVLCTSSNDMGKIYDRIASALEVHSIIPSFTGVTKNTAPTIVLEKEGSKYVAEIEDSNAVLDKFNFESTDDIKITRDGNVLKLESSKAITESDVVFSSKKNIGIDYNGSGYYIFSTKSNQSITRGTPLNDPPMAYFKVRTSDDIALRIFKVDKDSGKRIFLNGFGFNILDSEGNKVVDKNGNDTFYTSIIGSANINADLPNGTYYVHEVVAVGNYKIGADDVSFEITDEVRDHTISVTYEDEEDTGTILVWKLGVTLKSIIKEDVVLPDGSVVTKSSPEWHTNSLNDVTFTLYAEETIKGADGTVYYNEGDLVDESKTAPYKGAADGWLLFENLHYGTYRLHETAPDGYVAQEDQIIVLSRETSVVTINDGDTYDNHIESVSIRNYQSRFRLSLKKSLIEDEAGYFTGDMLAEEYQKVSYGLYYLGFDTVGALYAPDGTYMLPDTLIDVAVANEKGNVVFENSYPVGVYYVKELTTSEYFKLDTKKYTVDMDTSAGASDQYIFLTPDGDDQDAFINEPDEIIVNFMKEASDTKLPLEGAEIKIFVYDEDGSERVLYTGKSDKDGKFKNVPKFVKGEYYWEEITAPDGYKIIEGTHTFIVDPSKVDSVDITIEDDVDYGNLTITKLGDRFDSVDVNEVNGVTIYTPNYAEGSLADAEFTLFANGDIVTKDGTVRYHDGDEVAKFVTDENGEGFIDGLYYGNYWLEETKPPVGYARSFYRKAITISKNDTVIKEDFTDVKNIINVSIEKELTGVDDLDYVPFDIVTEVQKVSFGLYAAEDIKVGKDGVNGVIPKDGLIEVKYCDANGNIAFDVDLPNGKYYVKELTCSEYFVLNSKVETFTVEANDNPSTTIGFKIKNSSDYVSVKLKKVAKESGKMVPGAILVVKASDSTEILVGKTLSDGTLKRVTRVTNSDGSISYKEGEAVSELKLPKGSYTYYEEAAPEGYLLDTNKYSFDISGEEADGTVKELTIEDEYVKGKLSISKYGEIFASVTSSTTDDGYTVFVPVYDEGYLSGAKFTLYADEDIKTPDGVLRYHTGDEVATIVTNSDGISVIDNLYLGTYRLEEVEAPEGYILSTDESVIVKIDTDDVEMSVENKKKSVAVKLHKELKNPEIGMQGVDLTKAIQEVKFGLYAGEDLKANNGDTIKADSLISVKNCNADGLITYDVDLPYGKYYVLELETNKYYKLKTTKYEFTIDASSSGVIQLNNGKAIDNDYKEYKVSLKKVAKDTKQPLEGATIAFYDSKDDGAVSFYTDVTDENGLLDMKDDNGNEIKFPAGTYYYREEKVPEGYKLDSSWHEFKITGEEKNGTVIELDPLENEIITGSIKILKKGDMFTSSFTEDDGTVTPVYTTGYLGGAEFTILANKDIVTGDGVLRHHKGDKVKVVTTNDKGSVKVDDLYYGEYLVKETKAPDGYSITFNDKVVEIDGDSLDVKFEVEDAKNKVSLIANKVLEEDIYEQIDTKKEIVKVKFGIYANENLYYMNAEKSDANCIKKDSLLETAYADVDGNIVFSKDLPNGKYYAVELETSEKYVLDTTKHEFEVKNDVSKTLNLTDGTAWENETKKYPITFKKVAEDTNKPLAGAEIKIAVKDGEVIYTGITAEDGSLGFSDMLTAGTYTYEEVSAPSGYLRDTNVYDFTITGEEPRDYVVELLIKDPINMGNLSINKYGKVFATVEVDDEDVTTYSPKYYDSYLDGAVFGIYADGDIVTPDGTLRHSNGDLVDTITTNSDGSATSKDLYFGNYIIKELEAPYGYAISDEILHVTLNDTNAHFDLDYANNKNVVTVNLHKNMETDVNELIDAKKEILEVSFGIFATNSIKAIDGTEIPADGLIEKQYCNADGNIFFQSELPDGEYYVKELSTSKYYDLDENTYSFTVSNGESKVINLNDTYDFENYIIKRMVSLKKVDASTNKPLAGATVEVASADGKVVYRGTSGEDGMFPETSDTPESTTFPELPVGTYTYYEVEAPEGYIRDINTYSFEITGEEPEDYVFEFVIKNENLLGSISLTKVGERFVTVETIDEPDNTYYKPNYYDGSLDGAVFEVIAAEDIVTADGTVRVNKGESVGTMITDEFGTARLDDLFLGKYIVREISTPEGYLLFEDDIVVTLTPETPDVELEPIRNERHKVSVDLTKVMEKDDWNILNPEYEVQFVTFGLFAEEDIYADDGSYLPKDGLIEIGTCNQDGVLTFKEYLPYGKYYVKELTTSDYYILDDTHYTFEVNGDSDSVINLSSIYDFINYCDKTEVSFKKVATGTNTNQPLAGAKINIYYGDYNNGDYKLVYTGVTGTDGYLANVPALIKGHYTYHEVEAPYGYNLDSKVYSFDIVGGEKLVELVMENIPSKGSLEITKKDIATDEALPNCVIRLYSFDGILLVEKVTDSNGKVVFDELPVGKYYYQEFKAPEGYDINTGKYPFEITYDGQIIKAVLKDKKTPVDTPDTSTRTKTPSTPSIPVKTGETVDLMVFMIILVVSALVIVIMRKKLNNPNDK